MTLLNSMFFLVHSEMYEWEQGFEFTTFLWVRILKAWYRIRAFTLSLIINPVIQLCVQTNI